jgi:hypothetical protein
MGSLCYRLVSNKIAKSPKIVNPQTNIVEDLVWAFQYTMLAKKLVYTDKYTYHYRVNPQSLTAQYSDDINKIINKYLSSIPNVRVLEQIISESTFAGELNKYMVLRKFGYKIRLLPAVNQLRDDSLYINTFKEINSKIYYSNLIGFKDKLRHFLFLSKVHQFVMRFNK